jgi:hypothetical protein
MVSKQASGIDNRRTIKFKAQQQRVQHLRRALIDARARKKRFWALLLLFLLALEAGLSIPVPVFQSRLNKPADPTDRPNRAPPRLEFSEDWMPSADNDFAPRPGTVEYCDGLTREHYEKLRWRNRWDYKLYPQRYQDFWHEPSISEIVGEMKHDWWQHDAFLALKLKCPHDLHDWIDYVFQHDRGQFQMNLRRSEAGTISAFRVAAEFWAISIEHEREEEQRQATTASMENAGKDPSELTPNV